GHSFTVDVHNAGVSDADNLSLTDTVDSRLIVDSVTPGSYSCPDGDANPQTITCSLAHLGAGATKSITVNYHVASTTDSAVAVPDSAFAQSDEVGPTGDVDTVAIVEDVQLSVDKSFDSATVTAGGTPRTFTVSVSNAGVSDADNLHVTDSVDPRLIVDSIDAGDYNCSASLGQTVDCSLAHLASGATKALTVHYHVASTTDSDPSVGNEADASSDEDTASGTDTVAIVEDVQLSVAKSFADPSVTAGGDPSSFTISVANGGVSDADKLHVTDVVDPRLVVD